MSQIKSRESSLTIKEAKTTLIDLEEECEHISPSKKLSQKNDVVEIIPQINDDIS